MLSQKGVLKANGPIVQFVCANFRKHPLTKTYTDRQQQFLCLDDNCKKFLNSFHIIGDDDDCYLTIRQFYAMLEQRLP